MPLILTPPSYEEVWDIVSTIVDKVLAQATGISPIRDKLSIAKPPKAGCGIEYDKYFAILNEIDQELIEAGYDLDLDASFAHTTYGGDVAHLKSALFYMVLRKIGARVTAPLQAARP